MYPLSLSLPEEEERLSGFNTVATIVYLAKLNLRVRKINTYQQEISFLAEKNSSRYFFPESAQPSVCLHFSYGEGFFIVYKILSPNKMCRLENKHPSIRRRGTPKWRWQLRVCGGGWEGFSADIEIEMDVPHLILEFIFCAFLEKWGEGGEAHLF